ncbi:hypothetical protein GYMLUDRAFT_240571 [Collybiopsis luxurians FD-317 M1]|nr:hypothetical protein GYMLUDRAFT_240571 [Collybiopsis luxurians FD-317 M1]
MDGSQTLKEPPQVNSTKLNAKFGHSSRPSRNKNQRMIDAVHAEQETDEDTQAQQPKQKRSNRKRKGKGSASDPEDIEYTASEDSEDDSEADLSISNQEFALVVAAI